MGGLGNQMFQYAFARSLSLKYNIELKIDLSYLKNRNRNPDFVYRDYDLNLFNVHEDFEINCDRLFKFKKLLRIKEPNFHYSHSSVNSIEKLIKRKINIYLQGYWQSPIYFSKYEKQIREDFKFKNNIENSDNKIIKLLHKIKSTSSVMINVRRTDYLKVPLFNIIGLDYINKAKQILESKIQNPHYYIFSDDIAWCEENLKSHNFTIVDHSYKGDKFGYYLQLMSRCEHFIIPNSTFAWWSAWLNINKNKIVIAPKQWFTDINFNTKDLIPSDWITI